MNIKLNELNDKYRSEKRYKRDAFIHMLMGIIYEVNGDFNNAFIAYRNAVNIYREDYLSLYGLNVPEQLKKDLLRTAHVMGFHSDVLFYEKELGLKYVPEKRPASEIIFLWHNGLGPVKTEWSVNFNIIRNQHARSVYFVNEEFGFNFHYSMDESEYRSSGLNDLQFIRVAFPKYIERTTGFSTGTLLVDGQEHELEKVQDLNAIAFRSLQDRFHIEMGKALLRFAIKKATELRLRKENQNLGAVVGIVNAISEQADTRHWQTLPHDIQYARVPVVPGKEQSVTIRTVSEGADQKHDLIFKLAPGETIFHSHHTISSRFPVR